MENGSRALFNSEGSRICCSKHSSRMVFPDANASLVSLAAFS